MVSRLVRVASGFAAAFCLAATGLAGQAQTTPSAPAASPAPQAPSSQQNTPSTSGTPASQSTQPLQLHDLPASPHTPTPEERAQDERQRLLLQVSRLATLEAQWGPESSTPGLSIELKEVGRTKAPDGTTQIAWQITSKGFPADLKLTLMRWPLDEKPHPLMGGIELDSQGTAICAAPPLPAAGAGSDSSQAPGAPGSPGPSGQAPAPSAQTPAQPPSCIATTRPGQPVEVRAAMAPGEALRVALVGQTEKNGAPVRIGAATSLVPFPIEGTDKGCTLQVIRGMKNAGMVLVEGAGFPASAEMKVDTVTAGQTRTINTKTNASGRFILAALPALEGQDEGDTTVHMGGVSHPPSLEAPKAPAAAAEPGCEPSVTFHWGKDSYKAQ